MGAQLGNQRDEYLRLLVEIHGDQAIPILEKNLQDLGREVTNLNSLNQQGAIAQGQLTSELQRISRESAVTVQQINALRGQGGHGISGQGVMGLSFAVQDFMSANGDFLQGLYRIQNNIPVLLYQLGAGAGLAGTISLISLGIGLVLPKLLEFGKYISDTVSPVEDLRDKLDQLKSKVKELEKIEVKTNIETRDLEIARGQIDELKTALEALKKLRDELPATQKEAGEEFRKTFAELAPGGPRAAIDEIVERTYQREKEALEAPGGEIAQIRAKAQQAAIVAGEAGDIGGIQRAEELRDREIGIAYRRLREAVEQRVGAEARGAERGETPMIEAFARRAEGVGMAPLGRVLRGTTAEAMTAAKEEEAAFAKQIDAEGFRERRATRRERKEAEKRKLKEQERAEGEASDLEAHEFQREIDDWKLFNDLQREKRRSKKRKDAERKREATQEAEHVEHATSLDEQLQAAALAGRPRAAVREELMRAQPGISEAAVDQLLNRANEQAKLQTMEAGGDPHEAIRRLEEKQNRKIENQQADFMRSQVKEAIRAGAYGPEAAALPEQAIDEDVKKIVAAVQHGQNVDVAAVQTLHQSITAMEQMMMTNQAILFGYSDITTRLQYVQQQLQQQDNFLRNPMNAAQQQQLGWGR